MDFKKNLAKLIDLKTIITLTITGVLCYLTIIGTISGTEFLTIAVMVLTYYFSKKPEAPADTKTETITTETKTSGGEA